MKFKKLIAMALAFVMALTLAVPAMAAKPNKGADQATSTEKTINLKGEQSGTEFEYSKDCWSKWQNVIFVGGANSDSTDKEVSAWHLVYTDKKGINNDLKSMKLVFEKGQTYDWSWSVGLSTNGSGNNPGWMVVAPADWGKLDVAKSYIVTTSSKNVQFNISGYYQAGTKPEEPDEPEDPDAGKVSAVFSVSKAVVGGTALDGFTFAIYDANDVQVGTMTTGIDGIASVTIEKLEPGVYTIKEINQDADNYVVNTQVLTATLDETGSVTFPADEYGAELNTFTNYKLVPVQITVNKTVVGGTDLSGFQFALYDANGTMLGDPQTSDTEGQATFDTKLVTSSYTIKEIAQDTDNYVANTQEYTVVVDEFGNVTVTGQNDASSVGFTNYKLAHLTVNVETVVQEQIKQVHEVEYKWYGKDIEGSTVVSYIADFNNDNTIVASTGAHGNGFTYLIINKQALEDSLEGLTVRIGNSAPGVNKLCPDMKETGKAPTYTIRINEDGKLVATSDLGAFTIHVRDSVPDKKPSPGTHYNDDTFKPLDIPTAADGTFYLFFHGQTEPKADGQGAPYETDQVKGCHVVSTTKVETPVEYTVTVKNGDTVVDTTKGLVAGTYTITVDAKIDGKVVETWTKDVTLDWGADYTENFGKLVLSEPGEVIVECDNPSCPGYIPSP